MNAATGWTTRQAINQGVGEEHDLPEKQQQQAELDSRAAAIIGELASQNITSGQKEELDGKAESVLAEARAAGIQLKSLVSTQEIPAAKRTETFIKPAITYSPYSEEHVEAMQTVIRESREEDTKESSTIAPDLNPAPSFFKDPLGAVMHWLEKMVANMTTQMDEMAQHHAEQKLAYENPAFAEALQREGGSISPRTQELYTPLQQIAQGFAQDSGTPSSLRFEGCEGSKAMPDTKTYTPAQNTHQQAPARKQPMRI